LPLVKPAGLSIAVAAGGVQDAAKGGKQMIRIWLPIVLSLIAGPSLAQEKFAGSNVDVRTVLGFKAPDAAVQRMLPEGWEVNSPPSGPSRGFNLGVVLIEQIVVQDPEGKPVGPAQGAVLVVPVRKKGTETTGSMVVAGLFSAGGAPGAYGVYLPARAVVNRTQRTDAQGNASIDESWEFQGASGHSIEAQVQYVRSPPTRSKSESRVHSGARPDFFRIYRVDSASDVARSSATGIDRVSRISLKASGERFAPLFDGTEQLISVTSIPWYSRQVFLPGP
jgi:hypothetical protein